MEAVDDPGPVDDASAPEQTGDASPTDVSVIGDTEGAVTAPAAPRKSRRREWVYVAVVALVVAVCVRTFVLEQYRVVGDSMLGTLHDGDRVLVDKVSYRLHEPRRGDVVVLELDEAVGDDGLIKRVIAVPGDTIQVNDCVVRIDGEVIDEPYLDGNLLERDGCGPDQSETVVPAHAVFVLGDHRGASRDSRFFGTVDDDEVVGRARLIIWPFDDWTWL